MQKRSEHNRQSKSTKTIAKTVILAGVLLLAGTITGREVLSSPTRF
jgi:hypothetical protein